MKLNVVIAEAALELVPGEIRRSPAVWKDAEKRGLEPTRILLDRSFHHSAMARLKEDFKRGRPDLVHSTLLSMTCSPLYIEGRLRVFVHTRGDLTLEIAEKTRLPKNYLRFRGLMEKVLVASDEGGLIVKRQGTIKDLLRGIAPDWVCGLSTQGATMSLEGLAAKLTSKGNPCAIIGGFPHGHFSTTTLKELDELVRIDARPLDAHVVASRLVYEVEKRAREGEVSQRSDERSQ